jgi:hypothetical protein
MVGKMDQITKTLSNPDLLYYIQDNLEDLWRGTVLQGYRYMDNKQKGVFGEKFAEQYLRDLNFTVTGRTGGNVDYDLVINGLKVEVKFSVTQTHTDKKTGEKRLIKDRFLINHVGVGKDYDRLLFIGINPIFTESRIVWFDKKDIKEIVNNKDYFGYQQGGNKAENDDYMSGSSKLIRLINSKYARTLDQW